MNRFLYSGNFKLNLPLPRRGVLPPLETLSHLWTHANRTHIHTFNHSFTLGVPAPWIDRTAHSSDDRIGSKPSGQNVTFKWLKRKQAPPQYERSAATNQPRFISKARGCVPVNSRRPNRKQRFTKLDETLSKTERKNNHWLYFFYFLGTPSRIRYIPHPPPRHWYVHWKKKETLISEMRMTCGWRGKREATQLIRK